MLRTKKSDAALYDTNAVALLQDWKTAKEVVRSRFESYVYSWGCLTQPVYLDVEVPVMDLAGKWVATEPVCDIDAGMVV